MQLIRTVYRLYRRIFHWREIRATEQRLADVVEQIKPEPAAPARIIHEH